MVNFDRAIEQIIQNTIARGEFDNLAGKGKPLNLNENQLVDRDWRMAFSLLEHHGYAPPGWKKEINRRKLVPSEGKSEPHLALVYWSTCAAKYR